MLSGKTKPTEYQQEDWSGVSVIETLPQRSSFQHQSSVTVLQVKAKNESWGLSSIHCFRQFHNLYRRQHQTRFLRREAPDDGNTESLLYTSGQMAQSLTGLDDSPLDKGASMLPIYISNDALNEAVAREVRSRCQFSSFHALLAVLVKKNVTIAWPAAVSRESSGEGWFQSSHASSCFSWNLKENANTTWQLISCSV